MKKIYFILFIFIWIELSSANSYPNNVGVFCPATNVNTTTGYWFVGKNVELYRVFGEEIKQYDTQDVSLKGSNVIYFWDKKNPGDFMVYLDRQTLVAGTIYRRQCELVQRKSQMLGRMQIELNNLKARNKL